jgi:DNA-binding NarL/FixJ family response regulator
MGIRLVIADDHPLILKGIEHLLAPEPGFEIVACCGDGRGALEAVRQHRPDILIVDTRMPDLDGMGVIRALLRERPATPTRVVLHAESSDQELIREAVRLGVPGIVLKEMPPGALLQCLRKVHDGEHWLERRATSHVLMDLLRKEGGEREIASLLTPRERQVLDLLCRGLRNKQIAMDLSISEPTVKAHLQHISEKLQVRGRLALVRCAEARGFTGSIR